MGDAILSTVVMNTLKDTFPDCKIDFVLNEKICPLFKDHPSIDNIISFSEYEKHHFLQYIRKVWKVTHSKKYDIIIDMRSTLNTLPFTLFSLSSKYRIGIRKWYSSFVFNCHAERCMGNKNMIDHNLDMLKTLEGIAPVRYNRHFTLHITDEENARFREYMEYSGIDFSKPVVLVGVTAKLENKTWPENKMTWLIEQVMETYPSWQLIFNFAPGKEYENAIKIYRQLGSPERIFMNIEAKSQRALVAMSQNIDFYFGNEGGARHVVHAAGKPSFVICAPQTNISRWIPQNDIPAGAIPGTVPEEEVWHDMNLFIQKIKI